MPPPPLPLLPAGVPDVAAVLDDLVAARVVAVPGAMFATRGLQVRLGG